MTSRTPLSAPAGLAVLALAACAGQKPAPELGSGSPMPGLRPVDRLIGKDEPHFRHLWQVTQGGENAEAYWSSDGKRLVLQRRNEDEGIDCDRIFVTDRETGALTQVSDGRGTTTCSYFLPGDREVIFASTRASMEGCPPKVDWSQGYVWAVWPEHDIWTCHLEHGDLRQLTDVYGYDAEATVSPRGDRIVFTSSRSGDLELWTMDLDGGNPVQVTDELGYDGGAFFSHDGQQLIFRATVFAGGEEGDRQREQYKTLLADWRIRPQELEIFIADADGQNRRQVTRLGGANWAPYFFPDDRRIVFSTNHHDPDPSDGINFDIYAVDLDGSDLERVTTYSGFDAFPMFSPDGRYLAFSSNRGGTHAGETNVFVAEWR